MTERSFGVAEGVGPLLVWFLAVLLVTWLLVLLLESRGRRVSRWVLLSGVLSALLVAAAILRPTRVTSRGADLFPKVVVLMDRSWRLGLKAGDKTREQLALSALHDLQARLKQARLEVLGFGEGAATPFVEGQGDPGERPTDSDLTSALRALSAAPGERPKALVVVSDGRLTSPSEAATTDALRELGARLGVPIHTIQVGGSALPDASIRRVGTTGAAVAHQKIALQLSVGCSGGLACDDELPITVEELLHGEPAALLAQGSAKVRDGLATVELPFTLDRAGRRLVRVKLQAPDGDRVPENNQRLLTFDVTRERVRLLHVAGRPTYDVRALRMWLKADESIDLIAFFILRTTSDAMQADESELALIPFPVDELFTEHLPSFDAVILQDIDAVEYKLERHLPALARYVRAGGGLIMVGGPSAFMGGGYAGTPLAEVLPTTLPEQGAPFDTVSFEPRTTQAGRAAPALLRVRELLGDQLPAMQGSNTLGPLRPGAIALWEHPDRRAGNAAMPVLALGESGDGRSIALGVDGTHLLQWSELGERSAGRAHGALWEGLVGWLMRDPRYESARLDLTHECRAGAPVTLSITRLPGAAVDVKVSLERLGEAAGGEALPNKQLRMEGDVETATLPLGALSEGGYTATVRIGSAPPARLDFACERGGAAFADSRPDAALLERLSQVTGGISVGAADAGSLPAPPRTHVESQRLVAPLLAPWIWALLAASSIGAHWYVRRRAGLI
jgi:uncharacterized membrane protein